MLIQLRGGTRIGPAEYPPAMIHRLNERLNAIAAETDDDHTTEASA